MREALDDAEADRIVSRNKDDWNFSGSLPHLIQHANRVNQNYVRLRTYQIRRTRPNMLDVSVTPYHLDLDIATIRPTEISELLSERGDPRLS
jgi:hypothetical protein